MILQSHIIDRLKATTRGFNSFEGVMELSAYEDSSYRPPAAFIAPVRERAGDNARPGTGALRQVVTETFAVVIVLASPARSPDAVLEALKGFWDQLIAALVNWTYPGAASETVFAGGQLLRASGGRIAYQMTFSFRHQITA
jgi:hypothetical protein